jgi:hypothetical protein
MEGFMCNGDNPRPDTRECLFDLFASRAKTAILFVRNAAAAIVPGPQACQLLEVFSPEDYKKLTAALAKIHAAELAIYDFHFGVKNQ